MDDRRIVVRFPEIFVFLEASRHSLAPTQLPVEWPPKVLSLEVKQREREVAEAKNEYRYTSNTPYAFVVCTLTLAQSQLVGE